MQRSLVVLVIVLLTLFVADRTLGAVRGPVARPVNDVGLFGGTNALGTQLRPGHNGTYRTSEFEIRIRVNSLGLRGPELRTDRRPGTIRVLALGDSFTFGYGVEQEQAWPSVLQDLARARAEPVEVINAGFSGYSPAGYLRYLQGNGERFDPDLVLVAVFVGNDVLDELLDGPSGLTDAQKNALEAEYFLTGRGVYWGPLGEIRRAAEAAMPNLMELAAVARVKLQYALGDHRKHFDYILMKETPSEIARGWDKLFRSLEQIDRSTKAEGRRSGVVLIPFNEQVGEIGLDPGAVRDLPQQRLLRFCADRGIACLDLLPAFRSAPRPAELFYLNDGHWTPEGQRLAARVIDEWLRKEALWPRLR